MQIKGMNAIVTGSGKGIGREIALHFARSGASVAVADLDFESATAVARTIQEQGGKAVPIHVDISDSQQVKAMVSTAVETLGSVDILVNNAGIGHSASVMDTTDEDLDRVLGVNLKGTFFCSRENGQGHGAKGERRTDYQHLVKRRGQRPSGRRGLLRLQSRRFAANQGLGYGAWAIRNKCKRRIAWPYRHRLRP